MPDQPETNPSPQATIAALCEKLTQVSLAVAESREHGTAVTEELYQLLPVLRSLLADFQRDIANLGPDQGELEALYGISQAIGSSLDLQQVLNEVMDQIIRLTEAERAFLMLVDPESGDLEFRAARNMDRETIDSSAFEISRSIVKQVADSGEPIVTTNAQMDPRFKAKASVIGYNLRSILCVPLKVRGQVTGVIYADNRIRTALFADRDRDLLTTFASQAAIAIENARLFESVSDAKSLMDNVFASIPSGVITTDADGQITFSNRAVQQIMGLPASVKSSFPDALPTLESELHPLIDQVRTGSESVLNHEIEMALPDRGSVFLRTSLSLLKDADNETQGIAIVIDDLTEQRRLESRYQLFQRYLSPVVIERLPADPSELKLGGQRQEITSLFADIRGFTDFSQRHDPETLFEILNRYLDVGAKAVLSEEGTLDKFMGDAVVAFFNAPLPQTDHVLRAVRAALKMREAVKALHQELDPTYHLSYGAGITVGDAVVGNIGTAQRLDYTAIGPSMNMARRLQESAAPGQVLMAQSAYERAKGSIEARLLPPMQVEGIAEPIEAYELLGLK